MIVIKHPEKEKAAYKGCKNYTQLFFEKQNQGFLRKCKMFFPPEVVISAFTKSQ